MFDMVNHLWLLQVLFSALAMLGFSLRANIRGWKIIFTSLSGAICWGSYLIILPLTKSLLLSVFLSVVLVCIYAEFMSRWLKAPVSVFVICGIIPLVPGSGMYYSMTAYIAGKMYQSLKLISQTLMIAGTISVAVALVSSVANLFQAMIRRF